MDDIVVKTKDKATLIQDLEETFANLCKINLKLNPEKCNIDRISLEIDSLKIRSMPPKHDINESM